MDFCSKYGYDYGFEGSDSDEVSDDELKNESFSSSSNKGGKKVKKLRKADSNLIAVKFDQLVSSNRMFAGDPIRCKSCGAIMSNVSKKSISADSKTWKCEFCYESIDISAFSTDQIPSEDDVTFLIEPAPIVETQTGSADENTVRSMNNTNLTYCIDISGSMDTAIEVKSNEPQQRISHMSRLNGVIAACLESVDHLRTQEPNKRVALVTFSDNIKYYGDTSKGTNPILTIGAGGNNPFNYRLQQQQPQQNSMFRNIRTRVTNAFSNISSQQIPVEADDQTTTPQQEIAHDIMDNKEKMIALASNQDQNLKPISETFNSLTSRIKALRTEGSTALGPALTFSIGQTSHKSGSQGNSLIYNNYSLICYLESLKDG
jgi:hypothetical protein